MKSKNQVNLLPLEVRLPTKELRSTMKAFWYRRKKYSTPPSKHPLDRQLEAGLRGDFDLGAKIAEQLALETPECHRAAFNRAWYEMRQGKLLDGLKLLDRGRWIQVFGDKPLPSQKPIYRNEDLMGKHLLLCGEGGLGDEIINVRFAKDFADKGAKVTVSCDPSLKSIFARVPGVSSVVGHQSAPDVYHDYWVPAMSAARILEKDYQDLSGHSYLCVDEDHRQKWQTEFQKRPRESRPRIGLRFYGNPKFEHEQFRRFPSEALIESLEGRPWLNLQKESNPELQSWEDTLAAMDNLDLVITSCTSVAHASAALGKKTWVLVPLLPYYVWALPGPRSPWYDSVTLFRQTQFGTWDQVFGQVSSELNLLFPQ